MLHIRQTVDRDRPYAQDDADNEFPEARLAAPIVVEQAPGAALFVPSLWYGVCEPLEPAPLTSLY